MCTVVTAYRVISGEKLITWWHLVYTLFSSLECVFPANSHLLCSQSINVYIMWLLKVTVSGERCGIYSTGAHKYHTGKLRSLWSFTRLPKMSSKFKTYINFKSSLIWIDLMNTDKSKIQLKLGTMQNYKRWSSIDEDSNRTFFP